MAESVSENAEMILKGITRHVNCLGDDNRNTRKRALEGLRKETIGRNPRPDSATLQAVVNEVIKPVLKALSDPVEKCRDLSVQYLTDCLDVVPEPTAYLSYIIPVLVQRLGQQDITEPSEEQRLYLILLLSKLVVLSGTNMGIYMDDLIGILQRTISDPYQEVKKESCRCTVSVAKIGKQYFHMQSASLIKPLLLSIVHQHSKVRVEVIKAIGACIQYGDCKSADDVVSHLAQRLFDKVPAVRSTVIGVIGEWMLNLMDRYSFWHKFIPLLLSGITDEVPDISSQADALWHDVGLKYQQEQEEDLKDKLDWTKPELEHYPPGLERPNLGCRELVYRNFSKILSGLTRDLTDWVEATRIMSAKLLYTLVINDEDNVTQHLDKLLTALYKGCGDEEAEVQDYVVRTSELVGYFVGPETWVKMVLQQVKLMQSPGTLQVLAAIIRGSQAAQIKTYLPDICSILTDPSICNIADSHLQTQLLSCVDAMVTVSKGDCQEVSKDLFKVLITVLALHRHESHPTKVRDLLERLSAVLGMEDCQGLFGAYTKPTIASLKDEYSVWTQHSVERLVFDTLLMHSGPVVGEVLDDIIPMFVANLNPEKDPEVRLKFFTLLSRLLMNASATLDSQERFGDFAVTVVRDMILPNCVWRAGRTASAIRKTSISCLWALLQSGVLNRERLLEVMEDMMTQLQSSLEEDDKGTRLITCRVMMHIFQQVGPHLDQDRLHNMYPVLIKRLDDSSDDIRVAVCQTFTAYLNCFEDRYNASLYRAHLEAIYGGLLLHLDDPEVSIQGAVLDVLKTAARLMPALLLKEIDSVKLKHRTTQYLDELAEYTKGLPQKD